jgi:hypothetical protein
MHVVTSHPNDCIQFAATSEKDFGIFIATTTANGAEMKTLVMHELGFELWIGDPAETDARLLLRLLMEGRFPQIWVPGAANRDLRNAPVDPQSSLDDGGDRPRASPNISANLIRFLPDSSVTQNYANG